MVRVCRGVSRRGFLAVGALGGAGFHLADWLAQRAAWAAQNAYAAPPVVAESVIHVFLPGGLAAQETFDPKPFAPIEYRGELAAIATKLAGVQVSELLPQIAQIADRVTIVRSLTHGEADHDRGQHSMLTGYRPSPALQFPSLGSVVSHELGPRRNLPAYVCVPGSPSPHAGPGYLSAAFAPFSLGDDPARSGFTVRDLSLPAEIDASRDRRRRAALEAVNRGFVARTSADGVAAMNAFYERAFDLIASPAAREAFRIEAEPVGVRDRYGRHEAGQRMLLARRLVEAGVRFVTLSYGGWDHHQAITAGMRSQLPPLDQGLAALIADLDERGLLDSTLVMVTSEFGRTPKLNQDAGRDHWSKAFSVLLAGGGVRRGAVVGSSGATGAEPDDAPLTPEDLAATVYHQLGIPAEKELMAPGERPIEIVKDGRVRRDLLA